MKEANRSNKPPDIGKSWTIKVNELIERQKASFRLLSSYPITVQKNVQIIFGQHTLYRPKISWPLSDPENKLSVFGLKIIDLT